MTEHGNGKFKLNAGTISIVILLVFQIATFSFGYGMLTQQVSVNRQLIQDYQDTQEDILSKVDALSIKVTQLEVALFSHLDHP